MFLVYVLSVLVSGLIVGAVARAVIPGKQVMGVWATIGLGVAGSIAGGIVGAILFRSSGSRFLGLVLAVAAAAGLLWTAVKKGWVHTVAT
jgi:uncharacterized membrane protein YeaQ/YmgE (transglycosylase-associated protein family)